MQIILATPTIVRITWPVYDAVTEAEIVRRIKTVPGIEGMGRRYYCHVIQTARLMELFPKASFDYAALVAGDKAGHAFYAMCVYFGLELIIDESRGVFGVSENVSPIIQQAIEERSHAIKDLVIEALANPNPKPKPKGMNDPLHGPVTLEDAGWQRVMTGARNAAKKEEEKQFKFQKRRRKKKVEAV